MAARPNPNRALTDIVVENVISLCEYLLWFTARSDGKFTSALQRVQRNAVERWRNVLLDFLLY